MDPDSTTHRYIPRVDSSVLGCTLNHETVRLTATVDLEGYVLEVSNIEPLAQGIRIVSIWEVLICLQTLLLI